MTSAKMATEKIAGIKITPLQPETFSVQPAPTAPVPDARAEEWQQRNSWFGSDDEMTSFALGLHQKLVKQGVDPRSDEYYDRINARVRQVFPDSFGDADATQDPKLRRKANVVAPATRSTASKKVVLTATQVTLAKRLGVPLNEYAKQVALEMRKQNG